MDMNVEVLIYIYGAVCVCMIAFNIVYSIMLRGSEVRMERRSARIWQSVSRELERIRRIGSMSPEHLRYLERIMRRVNNLIALSMVLEERFNKGDEAESEYLRQIRPEIISAANVYRDRENVQAGYFAWFLACYTRGRSLGLDALENTLLDYMRKPNVYCRFNALSALYNFADAGHIAQALYIQDDGRVFLHDKLITDGLLSFKGDHKQLIAQLLAQLNSYTPRTQLGILNYIRFQSGDYKDEMFKIMQDASADKELRLAAIRYFGKYRYEPALKPILDFASDRDELNWEYSTVACGALTEYAGEEVIAALKIALHSSNWYVRYSAAQSLQRHDVDYSDVVDVAAGNDRYAREMMMYWLESRNIHAQEAQAL